MVTGRLQRFLGDDSAIHIATGMQDAAAWYYLRHEPSRVCRRSFSLQSGFWRQRRRAICAPMLPVLRRSLSAAAFCTAAKSRRTAPLAALPPVSVPAGEVIQDCLVRDAVRSEPVSLLDSLLNGNLQGIFRNLGDLLRCTRSQGHEFPQLFSDISFSKEQGIFSE